MRNRFLPAKGFSYPDRLISFCEAVEEEVVRAGNGEGAVDGVALALAGLLADDGWLAAPWRQAHPQFYQQHPLYIDPAERFSVVSFVWGPGQFTPIHDHGVWGVVGTLRGAEQSQRFRRTAREELEPIGDLRLMQPRDIDILKPSQGDIHSVSNAFDDRVSISIHAYGGNIGTAKRYSYSESGEMRQFVSSYSHVPPALTGGSRSSAPILKVIQ